jgi:hypothetical protein
VSRIAAAIGELARARILYFLMDGRVRTSTELSVVAGVSPSIRLRAARTCYDHMAGTVGVSLHDRFKALKWLSAGSNDEYKLTPEGAKAFTAMSVAK